jgi:two-component system invasion response regulator UvrY
MHNAIITVAYAEDQLEVRAGIVGFINSFPDCKVVADAENGAEMISKIAMLNTPPDVCIVDIRMPVMDGYETMTNLKKLYKDMKFIVLTSYWHDYNIYRMISGGVHGYLVRGCPPKELNKAIQEVLDNGYYYSAIAGRDKFDTFKRNGFHQLTPTELEYIKLFCTSLSFNDISKQKFVSERTIQDYQSKICAKLNLHTRAEIVAFAYKSGLATLNC